MSFNIQVEEGNIDEVADLFAAMGSKVIDQARVAATNKVMSETRKGIKKDIREETRVPAKQINKRMKLFRAKRNKDARLFVGTMPVKLVTVAKRSRTATTARSAKGRYSPNKAFTATMKSGHIGIFKRQGKARLKIDEQFVSIVDAARRSVRKHARVIIPKTFPKLFEKELSIRTTREVVKRQLN